MFTHSPEENVAALLSEDEQVSIIQHVAPMLATAIGAADVIINCMVSDKGYLNDTNIHLSMMFDGNLGEAGPSWTTNFSFRADNPLSLRDGGPFALAEAGYGITEGGITTTSEHKLVIRALGEGCEPGLYRRHVVRQTPANGEELVTIRKQFHPATWQTVVHMARYPRMLNGLPARLA